MRGLRPAQIRLVSASRSGRALPRSGFPENLGRTRIDPRQPCWTPGLPFAVNLSPTAIATDESTACGRPERRRPAKGVADRQGRAEDGPRSGKCLAKPLDRAIQHLARQGEVQPQPALATLAENGAIMDRHLAVLDRAPRKFGARE